MLSIGSFVAQKKKPGEWPPAEEFADRLARLRRARSYTNAQIAVACGVHSNTISNWKSGQTPEGIALLRLAQLFNVTPEWLLTGVDAPVNLEIQRLAVEQLEEVKVPQAKRRNKGK